jgi:hypothetical protein
MYRSATRSVSWRDRYMYCLEISLHFSGASGSRIILTMTVDHDLHCTEERRRLS